MGKGSSRRPTNEDTFKSNYDMIFNSNKQKVLLDELQQEIVEEPYDNELSYTYTEGRVNG